jgi:hypothetical protein
VTGRSATGFAVIRMVADVVPIVSIVGSPRRSPSAVDPSFSIRAVVSNANVFNSLVYSWISSPSCDGAAFATLDLADRNNLASPLGSNVLAFRTSPPVLGQATSYCVQVIVRDPSAAAGVFGSATYRFTTRREPAGGSCVVLGNNTGIAFNTVFRFRCGQWTTDALSGNVAYTFNIRGSDGKLTPLGQSTRSGVFTYTFLTPGTYTIQVTITDDAKAIARVPPTMTVVVSPNPADPNDLAKALSARAKIAYENSGNTFELTKTLSALAKFGGTTPLQGSVTLGRRDAASDLQDQTLAMIQSMTNKATIDFADLGPVVTNMMLSLTAAMTRPTLIDTSMSLLYRLASDMNNNGRDVRTCFNAETMQNLLTALDRVVTAAQTTTGVSADTLPKRESILQAFTACAQRIAVCGGNPSTFSTGASSLTLGGLSTSTLGTKTEFGVFSMSSLVTQLGLSGQSCVSYRYDNGKNLLLDNETISDLVFTLDFRNTAGNAGGVVRGSTATAPTPGKDLITATFNPPVVLTLPIDASFKDAIANGSFTPACIFFKRSASNMNDGTWSGEGCTMKSYTSSQVTCECTHLTEYALSITRAAVSPAPPPGPTDPATGNTSNVGAIAGAIAAVVCVAGLVGFFAYKRVERTKAFDGGRVEPLADDKDAHEATRQEPVVDATSGTVTATTAVRSKLVKVRDPTLLPAYNSPPSYDQHMAMKSATSAENKRQEKLNGLLKDQKMDEDPVKSAELP